MWRAFSKRSENQLHINSPNEKKGTLYYGFLAFLLYELCTQRFATWQRLTFVECSIRHMSSHVRLFCCRQFSIHARIFNADIKSSYANQKSSFGWMCFFFGTVAISVVTTETADRSNAGKTDSLRWIPIQTPYVLQACVLFFVCDYWFSYNSWIYD